MPSIRSLIFIPSSEAINISPIDSNGWIMLPWSSTVFIRWLSRELDNSRLAHVQHFIPSIPSPLQHTILLKDPEVFAILHNREYFVLIEAFRMYWNERSSPISRHYRRSLSFSLTQPCFISHLLFGSHTHPLTSTESLYHSFQHISPPPYPHT